MLGSVEDAADACQDIFIAAYEKAHSFKGNSKFSTWLYRIAINNCISKLRRKKIEQKIYDNSLLQASLATKDSAIRDDETTLIKNQLSERIMKAIQKLPDEQKAILELKIYQDLSFEEISKIIGIPVGTAKSRLHYALIKIRNELKDLNPNNPNNMR
jgi:RNA polymerase sigma-70 factor (ECF subfamily)